MLDVVMGLALVLAAVLAGFWATWSVVVLPALDSLPAPVAVAAMRRCNETVLTPLFLVPFATAPLTAAAGGVGLLLERAWLPALLVGFAVVLQVVGVVVVTGFVNVPLNGALAEVQGAPSEAWAAFSGPWQRANLVRTASGLAALVVLLVAARMS